jgi:hypothetical protein
MLQFVGEDIVRFRNSRSILVVGVEAAFGLAVACGFAFSGGSAGHAFAVVALGLIVYSLLMVPYEASVGPGNQLVFRSLVRKRSLYVEDVRRAERRAGEGGVHWKFSFIQGASRLNGSAGQDLAEYLSQINPTIQIDYGRRGRPNKRLLFDPKEFEPELVNEPDWVQRGEKLSAQDLVRRDQEASRRIDESLTGNTHAARRRRGKGGG